MMDTWLLYDRACGLGVNRMWKEGNRMSVSPEAVRATVRSTSKLRPDFQGGQDLARWFPGQVWK